MSPCDLARMYLTALADGELPEEEAARLEAHLIDCADCRRESAQLGAVLGLADAWQLPRQFQTGVTDADARKQEEPRLMDLLLTEMRALREEVVSLRAEIAEVRREPRGTRYTPTTSTLTRESVRHDPPSLLPYAPPIEADLFGR